MPARVLMTALALVFLAAAGAASARVAPPDPEPAAPFSAPVPRGVKEGLAARNVSVTDQPIPIGRYVGIRRALAVAAAETPACSDPGPTSAHLVSVSGGGLVHPPDLVWLVVEHNVCEWVFGPGPGGTYDADLAVFVDARTGGWLGALSF
jgi:hypothetical protein